MSARNASDSKVLLLVGAVLLAGCGGGGSHGGPPPTYTVGASVSGLSGSGLTLLLNGGGSRAVSGNGNVSFSSTLDAGASYAVTVGTQPSSPSQTCTVSNGSGTIANADVGNVAVACVTNTYTVGVNTTGVSGSGLTVQINGGDNLNIAANGGATFSTPLASGTAYSVTVLSTPAGQACVVSNGSGTVGDANITNVGIACGPGYTVSVTLSGLAGSNVVLALNANKQIDMSANGTQTFSPLLPTGASYAVTVVTQPATPAQTCIVANPSGTVGTSNVTLTATCTVNPPQYSIGGTVTSLAGTGLTLQLNGGAALSVPYSGQALTNFSFPTTLLSGAPYTVTVKTQPATPAQACTMSAGSGTVASANVTNIQVICPLILPPTVKGDWTLMSVGAGLPPTYGTQGVGSAANSPGGRYGASTWTDASGNLWVFGGATQLEINALLTTADLNDLWEYTPSTGAWRWVTGSTSVNAGGVYGTQGIASATNTPGARDSSSTWKDAAGNFWLFGGGNYNDLWKFDPVAETWTWVNGSNTAGATGVYGSQGTPAAGNVPGARSGAVAWVDAQGNFWIFGGDVTLASGNGYTVDNDLWRFNPLTGLWTWMSGMVAPNSGSGPSGVYGTKGTAAVSNIPGGRSLAAAFASGGKLWLFGGGGNDVSGTSGLLNDLWTYDLSSGLWTWVGGVDTVDSIGVYGTQGVASSSNIPSGRSGAMTWLDSAGNFWLFGGWGYGPVGGLNGNNGIGIVADFWKFEPANGTWTAIDGFNATEGSSHPGIPTANIVPDYRTEGMTWLDPAGNLWLYGGGRQDIAGLGAWGDMWLYTPLAP